MGSLLSPMLSSRRKRGAASASRDPVHLRVAIQTHRLGATSRGASPALRSVVRDDAGEYHLIACGLIGEPVPPVMISGGPQKKNS